MSVTKQYDCGATDLALFQNIFVGGDGAYWSSTEYAPEPDVVAWVFNGGNNTQNGASKVNPFFAWAVHDGDIGCSGFPGEGNTGGEFPGGGNTGGCFPGQVPAPAAIWLFSTGLIGLIAFTKRRKTA